MVHANASPVAFTTLPVSQILRLIQFLMLNNFNLSQCLMGLMPGAIADPGKAETKKNDRPKRSWSIMLAWLGSLPALQVAESMNYKKEAQRFLAKLGKMQKTCRTCKVCKARYPFWDSPVLDFLGLCTLATGGTPWGQNLLWCQWKLRRTRFKDLVVNEMEASSAVFLWAIHSESSHGRVQTSQTPWVRLTPNLQTLYLFGRAEWPRAWKGFFCSLFSWTTDAKKPWEMAFCQFSY